ncbi:MAG: hypothetical protein M3545_14735 [Acidobacteriota bacterium]|nr:hypothetical protein [Acidobacteriota bacterium]
MDYCEHCEGQRFDRARVLRALREVGRRLGAAERRDGDKAIALALRAVRELDIPHLELVDVDDDEVIH